MDEALAGFKGRILRVPSTEIEGRTVIVTGRALRIATLRDEELVQGELVPDPPRFIAALKESALHADVFTFPQNLDQPTPKYDYSFEWDNAAVADTRNYNDWWEQKLPQETRKNVRRSAKRGVVVKAVEYDEAFVRGIKEIYDETPIRQGSPFWHYGKDIDAVRRENGTYRERCEYIGAYFEEKLIGFMRFVYVDKVARIMQILASIHHSDKRPMNALIAKGVEICHERGMNYLVYSQFTFGNKKNSALAEFKRRNGFEEMKFSRYFIPLTAKGRIAVALKLHRGLLGILPPRLIDVLLKARTLVLKRKHGAAA